MLRGIFSNALNIRELINKLTYFGGVTMSGMRRWMGIILFSFLGISSVNCAETSLGTMFDVVQRFSFAGDGVPHGSYYDSALFSVKIPGSDKVIVIPFGFNGAGSIFAPLPDVKPEIRAVTSDLATGPKTFSWESLSKAIVLDRTHLAVSKINWEAIVKDAVLRPSLVVALKLWMLSGVAGLTALEFWHEAFTLLFRLGLSHEGTATSDKFSMLIEQALSSVSPMFGQLAHELTMALGDTTLGAQDTLSAYSVESLIIKDKEIAQALHEQFKGYSGNNFKQDCALALFTQHKCQVADISKRAAVGQFTNPAAQELAKKIVWHKPLGCVTPYTSVADVPQELLLQVKATQNAPCVIFTEYNGEYWVSYVSTFIGHGDVVKIGCITIIRALKEYIRAKRVQADKDPIYKAKLEQDAQEHRSLRTFLKTRDGQDLIVYLQDGIARSLASKGQRYFANDTDRQLSRMKLLDEIAQINQAFAQQDAQYKQLVEIQALVSSSTLLQSIALTEQECARLKALKIQKERELSNLAYVLPKDPKQVNSYESLAPEERCAVRDQIELLFEQAATKIQDKSALCAQRLACIAQDVKSRTIKARELIACRAQLVQHKDLTVSSEEKAHMVRLTHEAGDILDNKTLEPVILLIVNKPTLLQDFVADLRSSDQVFVHVRKQLHGALTMLGNVPLLKGNAHVGHYLLNVFVPTEILQTVRDATTVGA